MPVRTPHMTYATWLALCAREHAEASLPPCWRLGPSFNNTYEYLYFPNPGKPLRAVVIQRADGLWTFFPDGPKYETLEEALRGAERCRS